MQINVIGQGTVQQNQQSISQSWEATVDYPYNVNVNGTVWTLTAVPNINAWFDRFEITYHYVYESSTDGGSTWQTIRDDDYSTTSWNNPITATPEHAFLSFDRYICFEGTRMERTSGSSTNILRYTFSNQNITAYFTGGHIPTHLIIRDDTTGKIMYGGNLNKILRDD